MYFCLVAFILVFSSEIEKKNSLTFNNKCKSVHRITKIY